MAWLLPAHLLALAAFWWLPAVAARRDAAVFNADVKNDDFKTVFHRQRLLWRAAGAVVLAALASGPLLDAPAWFCASALALLIAGAGMWAFRFNPLLNLARRQAYVSEFYVSYSANAAWFPDRYLWARAYRQVYPGRPVIYFPDAAVRAAAGPLLRRLLRWGLVAALAVYVSAAALLLLHTYQT